MMEKGRAKPLAEGRLIDEHTTIKSLLDEKKEEVLNVLPKLNKNFSRLRNPVLRTLLAGRVTIAGACRIAGCSVSDFLSAMAGIGFKITGLQETKESPPEEVPVSSFPFPAKEDIIELDVRPVLLRNEDPLKEILEKAGALDETQCLKVITGFEPVPLIHLLKSKGFIHHTEGDSNGVVCTWFKRSPEAVVPPVKPVISVAAASDDEFEKILKSFEERVQYLDVTGLEMPKPMITILENLQILKAGEALFVRHKKIPVFLLPHLQEKGFEYLFKEMGSGRVDLLIYKP